MAIGTLAAIAIGAGTIGSAAIGAGASNKAANAATQAADQSAAVQREIYQSNKALLTPNIDRGNWAGNAFSGILGLNSDPAQNRAAQDKFKQFLQGSDYAFQFGEGANAINSGYAGSGTVQSGAAMRALEDYRQNLQSGYRTQYLNALAQQEGAGLTAGGALAGVGTNYANAIGNINSNRADAIGNAALSNAQNINSLIGAGVGGILKYGVKG